MVYYYTSVKKLTFPPIMLAALILSCASDPLPLEVDVDMHDIAVTPEQYEYVVAYDLDTFSEEMYEVTMSEIRELIEALNAIIRAKDYEAWVSYLSYSHYSRINSQEFLERKTDDLFRRDRMLASAAGRNPAHVQRRVLSSSMDFFFNVVVPARYNDRLDDIVFLSHDRVLAFTVDHRGNRLLLYGLQLYDTGWKISN